MSYRAILTRSTSDADQPLTPREVRLRRAGDVLLWGALACAVLALLLLMAGAIAAMTGANGTFDTVHSLFLSRYSGPPEQALMAVSLLLLGNVAALLVTMVGLMAQEAWGLLLAWLVAAVNMALLVILGNIPALLPLVLATAAGAICTADWRSFRINPVMLKEIRERMRGARAFVVISVYLGLMSAFAVLLYLIQRGVVINTGSAVTGELGRVVFAGVVGIELLLIVFIAPAFTAGAVSNERERRTYELLQITLLPKSSFIVGKLESALSYVFLLLLAAIPLQSIAFLFGGVTEFELLLAFVILAVTAVTLGAVGVYFSTTVERTLTASVRAYAVAFAVIVAAPILLAYFVSIFDSAVLGTGTNITRSPVLEAALIYLGAFIVSLNPILTATSTQQLLIEQQQLGFWQVTLSSDGSVIPLVSPWISFTIFYLVIATVLVVLAVRRMRRAEG